MLIMWTNYQACCTLRIPVGVVVDALFKPWVLPKAYLAKLYAFTNMLITLTPGGP